MLPIKEIIEFNDFVLIEIKIKLSLSLKGSIDISFPAHRYNCVSISENHYELLFV